MLDYAIIRIAFGNSFARGSFDRSRAHKTRLSHSITLAAHGVPALRPGKNIVD